MTHSSSHRPSILVTLDMETSGGYSQYPWYALRHHYTQAIYEAGGIPYPIPHHADLIDTYLDSAQGIVFTGGDFDIPPSMYGEQVIHPKVNIKAGRTSFEMMLFRKAYVKRIPILGICGGMQLMNVALGGSLIQDIADMFPTDIPHEQPNPRTEPGHSVQVVEETLLHQIVRESTCIVNSAHHQAIKRVAPTCRINAKAEDGLIEGIEDTAHPFCLGVQWHPEYHVSPADRLIFDYFMDCCQKGSEQ